VGEGECWERRAWGEVAPRGSEEGGIHPVVLEAKEAVSLINGTQAMLRAATLALLAAQVLVDSADVIAVALTGRAEGYGCRV